uniref:WGS project CAEQ00000000 data, annotated contig 700 n=1 Tax=Trypanosoma congolense (strain IL3000) TaxID=1068625 RepID=F9WHX0_TRYCI|nr:unnamed protein product [Trypanosoma congolense IL3000]
MDRKKVVDYPAGTEFDICSWDLTDNSYCITLGRVKDSGDMCDSGVAWGSLGTGAMVAIIACGLLLLIILVLLLICLLRRCCCGRAKEPDGQLVVRRKMDVSSVNLSDITETSGDPSQYGRVNPLLICLNSREESQAVTPHATSPGNGNVANPFTWLGDLSPGTHEFTIDDVERDDRDQIALQEARDRYNMAVAFTEGIERLRVTAKEREIHLDDSGEFNMYEMAVRRGDDGSFRPDIPLAGTSDLLNEIYMRRASQRERAYFRPREEIEVSVMNNMSELSTDNHDTSRLTSCDSMNYTTTQNFYDENAFVSESEAGRRLRMMNWEEEEWQAIVDTEFSDYVRLQQATQSTPLPLPHAVVFPFDAPLPVDEDGENHDTSQDDDLIIYEDGVTSVQVYDAPVVASVVGRTQQSSVPREGSGLHPSTSLFSSPAPVELRRPSRGSGVFNVLSGPSRGM